MLNFKNFENSPRLVLSGCILVALTLGIAAYFQASGPTTRSLEAQQNYQLNPPKSALNDLLNDIQRDLSVVAASPMISEALSSFSVAWLNMSGDASATLQNLYIHGNQYPAGQKDQLNAAADDSEYTRVHKRYHPWFREYLQARDYYDVFLFDLEGNLVYSVYKEADFATNFTNGQWKATQLAQLFAAAKNAQSARDQFFKDFSAYGPSNDAPASFIGMPVTVGNMTIGVLAIQIPIKRLNSLKLNQSHFRQVARNFTCPLAPAPCAHRIEFPAG